MIGVETGGLNIPASIAWIVGIGLVIFIATRKGKK